MRQPDLNLENPEKLQGKNTSEQTCVSTNCFAPLPDLRFEASLVNLLLEVPAGFKRPGSKYIWMFVVSCDRSLFIFLVQTHRSV